MKHVLTTLLLTLLAGFCLGQEKPGVEKLDEFEKISPDSLSLRLDSIYLQFASDSSSTGYVLIHGKKGDLLENLSFERCLYGFSRYRLGGDLSRLVVVRASEEDKFRVELWKVPKSATLPFSDTNDWNLNLSHRKKAFVFYDDFAAKSSEGCLYWNQDQQFADLLHANPDFIGHIVFYSKSKNQYLKDKKRLLNELIRSYKIPNTRLKSSYVRKKYSSFSYWLVPSKKKRL